MGSGADPSRPVDVEAGVAVGVADGLASVESEADPERLAVRPRLDGERALGFDGGLDGVLSRVERCEAAVAVSVHQIAAIPLDGVTDNSRLTFEDRRIPFSEPQTSC